MEIKELDVRRAATYLVVREDLRGSQSRKTSRKVTCTPPNVKCGGRCIPPNWDCRLKGQGTNSELKVHSQDISAGIASTQRGVSDLVKGVRKLNPAQVERGRRSVIRGAVKLAPGDNLEQKKQLRRNLDKKSNLIFGGLTVSIAVAAGYAKGRGSLPADIRNAIERPAKTAFNAVMDRAPFLGARRERNRAQGGMAATTVGGALVRGARIETVQNSVTGRTATGMGPLAFRSQSMNTFESNLVKNLDAVNREAANRGFDSWRTEATQVLFGAKTNKDKDSIFSERAANEFLTSQYGLPNKAVTKGFGDTQDVRQNSTQTNRNNSIERELGSKLNLIGSDFRRDMTTRGILSQKTYISEVALKGVNSKLGSLTAFQRKAALAEARTTIEKAMEGKGKERATELRLASVEGYNKYFGGVSKSVERFAGNPVNRDSPIGDANQALTRFVIGRKTGSQPQILSKGHGDLLLRQHFHTEVTKQKSDFVVSNSAAQNVAQTIIRSTTKPTAEQAIKILNTNGFPQATLVRASRTNVKTGSSSKSKKGLGAAQRQGELAKSIMKRKGFTGTLAEAYALARKEMQRGDSAPRVAAYLQTREDLRGKPCGSSHIPKAHDCTKVKGKGKEAPPESSTKTGGISGKKIAAAVLVGSVGAVAVAAASDAYQLNSGLGMPDTLTVRSAVKPHLNGGKGSDPVVMQAAMGRYYDKQIKEQGWKVGDLVYAKTKNEPVSHFGIYMGKTKTGAHSFATMGVDGLNGKQGGIDVLEAGAGARRKTGLLYAKAPTNKQPKVKYSPEEIANRVSKLEGKKLDYDTFNANCESWANMIVSGKSRSTQSQRLTLVGKTAIRAVYKSLESVSALDEDYPKQVRSGDRIQKVASWLDKANPRGNDFGYQAMVQRDSKYRKDAADPEYLGLIDPSSVIKERMSDIEAVSATKRWLMVLTAATSALRTP